jgi:hypothetical protein
MTRLTAEHWALIAGFLAATATVVGGLDHWADLGKPAIVAGFLMQLAVLLRTIFAAPVAPKDDPGSVTPPRLPVMLLAAALGTAALTLTSCGSKLPPIQPAPVMTQAADQDLHAAAIKAEGILLAAGVLTNHASLIESELYASGVLSATLHREIQRQFGRLATAASVVIRDIDTGATTSWASIKARLDPLLAGVQSLIDLARDLTAKPSGQTLGTALADLQSVLGQAVALLPAQ